MEDFKSWNDGWAHFWNNPIDQGAPKVTLIEKPNYFVVRREWVGRASEKPFKTIEEAQHYMEAL